MEGLSSCTFELCCQIWGGSPATETLNSGIETVDLDREETPEHEPGELIHSYSAQLCTCRGIINFVQCHNFNKVKPQNCTLIAALAAVHNYS